MTDSQLLAEFDLAHVAVLCAELPRVDELEQLYVGVPANGSNAELDVADLEGTEVEKASWVSLLSRLWLAAAQECLLGLAALFNSPIRNHAPRSLLRSVLEHSGRAHWVVAAADADGRGARAWLARYVGIAEELRISESDQGATGAMAKAPERERSIRSRIVELFGEEPDCSGLYTFWTLRDQEYGSFTRVVQELLTRALQGAPVEAMYPTLSLLVHPTTSGLLAFGSRGDEGQVQIPQFEPSFLVGATLTTLVGYRQALLDVLDHHGWAHPRLEGWTEALEETIVERNARP